MRGSVVFMTICLLSVYCGTVGAQSMSELNIKSFDEKKTSAGTESIKNPFIPGKASPQDLSVENLYLTGIAIGDGKKFALINGFVFSIGDRLAGLTIRSISEDSVVLQQLDKIHTLRLDGGL